jgi:RNA polymerase sigma-70 factor, ECF subfamily
MATDADTLHSLLGRIRLRDQRALRDLYELTGGRLLAIAQRLLQDRGAAEDVLQEVFLTLWEKIEQMPALQSHPLAWLTSLVRNRSIDAMRKRRPEDPLEWQDADGNTRTHDITDENSVPLKQLLESESDNELSRCMQLLAEDAREAIRLAYFNGLTHQELAQRLQRPLGTIKAWVRRGLLNLRECLGEPA